MYEHAKKGREGEALKGVLGIGIFCEARAGGGGR